MCKLKYLLTIAAISHFGMASAFAANHFDVKAGLWRIQTSGHVTGAMSLSDLMEKLRADAEGSHTFKECVSEEQMEQGFNLGGHDESCKKIVLNDAPKVMELREECTGEKQGSGTIHLEAVTSEEVKGSLHIDAVGLGIAIDKTILANWLGANCGHLRPGSFEKE